ncbi:enoyl-CoA hydratase-related protein [Rhodoferax ferrireducens]|uniref:enoyl-CoA hydratase/isomerase family protein n=1 Tax=Rhodoferax ferrireducens TaxID=192843 RepID=UPI00298E91F7|nr:enoyl-CoA hydratase-related protein [Rhodoferax ferrireducens]WPC67977.1 enoyl-CoA hydratase-related protein [Rhodoferax ferrireducens]
MTPSSAPQLTTVAPHPAEQSAAVLCWRDGAVAHLRFNRPQALNAIDTRMANEFHAACQAIADDAHVRVVWVSAEGRAFMAGGDLSAMRSDPLPAARALIAGMHGGLRLLAGLQAPVVASVQGAVAGGGFGLMLGCDLVIAAEGTRFGIAYPLIGASCDCSTSWGLPRLVGLRKALELALLSENIDAAEALRLGLVNRVVPTADLALETGRLVRRLADGPTLAYGHLKRLMRTSFQNGLDTHLDAEAEDFLACAQTDDFAEGVGAFLDKRAAVFTGH